MLLVQDRVTSTADPTETPAPTIAPDAVPTATDASLTVSNDPQRTVTLDRDAYDVSIEPDFERGFALGSLGVVAIDSTLVIDLILRSDFTERS